MSELKAYKGDVAIPVYGTIADADVYLKKKVDAILAKKDKEIAELKAALERDFVAKKSAEKVLRDLLDCGLIKEWFYNGTFHAVLKADDPHLEIAELKHKLEDVNELIKAARQMLENAKASHFEEMADAGMENRIMKRALWLARAERASDKARIFYFAMTENVDLNINGYSHKEKRHTRMLTARWWEITWLRVERKCRAKAELYK